MRRERSHQIARIGLATKPTGVIGRCKDDRHAVMDVGHQLVGIGGDDSERPNPFARSGLFPVLPNAGDPEWRAVFHCDGVGLLRLLPFDRFPFKETVHRHDAAALAVRIAKRRQIPHSLVLCVDRLAATRRVLTPIRDQTPAKRIERDFAGLMIAADDRQLFAWRSVPSWRIIVHATIAHVHAIDDGITKRSAALDDPPTHGSDIVIYQRSCQPMARCTASGSHAVWRVSPLLAAFEATKK